MFRMGVFSVLSLDYSRNVWRVMLLAMLRLSRVLFSRVLSMFSMMVQPLGLWSLHFLVLCLVLPNATDFLPPSNLFQDGPQQFPGGYVQKLGACQSWPNFEGLS